MKLVEVRFPWNKTGNTPKSTGITPHFNQLAKLGELKQTVKAIPNQFIEMTKSKIDGRDFLSTAINTAKITDSIDAMSVKIVTELQKN